MRDNCTTELVHAQGYTLSPVESQVRRGPSDATHDLQSRAPTAPALGQLYLPTHVQREVNPVHDDDYPYWDREADIVRDTLRGTDTEATCSHQSEPTQLCHYDSITDDDQRPCYTEVSRPRDNNEATLMTVPLLSIDGIGYTDADRASLDVPHTAGHQADSHCHTTIERWRWHMTCNDGTQLTAIQFADDLLVSDAHHTDIQHLAAVLRMTALAR
jgi:hypothetical protein